MVGPLIRFPVERSREEEPAAEISGVLEFDNDCLYLRNAEVEERYVVVWPAGSDWDAEEQVVHFVRGPDLPVGGTYFDGGGYDDLERVARAFGPEARALLTRCTAGAAAAIGVVGGI